jgi:hypothetical protein
VLADLLHLGGVRVEILTTGTISVGDPVEPASRSGVRIG